MQTQGDKHMRMPREGCCLQAGESGLRRIEVVSGPSTCSTLRRELLFIPQAVGLY